MEKLVLIDGNSLINRAFYAMPLLTTKDGSFTNAVYGFMNMFFKMISDVKPTHVAVAFDVHAPTFRHGMFAEYKGTRKPMPEELRPQIPLLKSLLGLMGVYTIEKAGLEADDLIGTIAKNTDVKTVIFTGDKDSFQLVDENTEVHFTRRGITETEVYDHANFKEKTGIDPVRIIDLKALMGDSSDNIPGVAGVGEKTALSLVQTYGTIDNLYAHTDELKGKLKEKIEAGKDSAYMSRTLATINTRCEVDYDINEMSFSLPLSAEVKKEFIRLEFKSLYSRNELFSPSARTADVSAASLSTANGSYTADLRLDERSAGGSTARAEKATKSDVGREAGVPAAGADGGAALPLRVERITTAEEFGKKAAALDGAEELAIAFENNLISVFDGKTEYALPIKETLFDEGFTLSEAAKLLAAYFTGDKTLILYDKKQTRHLLYDNFGINLTAPCRDVSILKYLTDYSGRSETFAEVMTAYGKDETAPAAALRSVYETLFLKLKEENTTELYEKTELPLSDVLFEMEETGFKIDYDALDSASKKYKAFLEETEREIKTLAGAPDLNVNSPRQLGEVLFEKLKIGKGKKTKSGYSTTAEILESLEDAHPVVPLILKYRRIQKLQSTYVEGFKPLIDKKTGLIKTSFNQTVTSTGRLSSKEPNLQNIPVRDEEGKELRKFFVPRSDDRILVSADYSQIELRLLAAFSGCKGLIDAFNGGKDVHAETAAKVFGVPLDKVTPEMRRSAKAVNFGIIYGISEYGLAKNVKTSAAQAREYIAAYFREYPEVKKYMDDNVAFAREHGYAVTMLGRRRYIREISSPNYNLRQFGESAAMNMPLQGSAADIIKIAMINVFNRLKRENLKSQLILQIHDELIIDAFKSEREAVERILVEEMGGAANLSVPLTVSLGAGETWYDAK